MTLLVSLVNHDCIVLANDLQGDDGYTIDATLFKHSWIGPGILALFATGDVDSCNGILERVRLAHSELVAEGVHQDPYSYADAVGATARAVLAGVHGEEWKKEAPQSAFVVAGFRYFRDKSHAPLVLYMTTAGGFEPKPLDKPCGLWGHDEIARHYLDNLVPDWPLNDVQMAVLAVFLIQESALVLKGVGNTAFVHVIRPGREPVSVPIDVYRRLSAIATRIGENLRNSIRRDLELDEWPMQPFPPGLFPDTPGTPLAPA